MKSIDFRFENQPVLNADDGSSFLNLRFENDVKEYGFQTAFSVLVPDRVFENDVKEYGFQTPVEVYTARYGFENDVKEYGFQTHR